MKDRLRTPCPHVPHLAHTQRTRSRQFKATWVSDNMHGFVSERLRKTSILTLVTAKRRAGRLRSRGAACRGAGEGGERARGGGAAARARMVWSSLPLNRICPWTCSAMTFAVWPVSSNRSLCGASALKTLIAPAWSYPALTIALPSSVHAREQTSNGIL